MSSSFWVFVVALLALVATTAVDAQASFVRGDCNGDGNFDISDAVTDLDLLFGSGTVDPPCLDACDANDDGSLDIADAVSMLESLFVLGASPLPPPGPACGLDPTADLVSCETPTSGCGSSFLGFETILQGQFTGLAQQETIVRTEIEWQALWAQHRSIFIPAPPIPSVDFGTEMVIAIVTAETGPDITLETTQIEVIGGEIHLDYDYVFCPSLLTVIVQPFQILRVDLADGGLVTEETFVAACP